MHGTVIDSRQTLSQREKELVDSADKCRETMENQMNDLRKQCSSLEQDIASAREDNKSLQQQLRDKVRITFEISSFMRYQTSLSALPLHKEEGAPLCEGAGPRD